MFSKLKRDTIDKLISGLFMSYFVFSFALHITDDYFNININLWIVTLLVVRYCTYISINKS